MSNNDKTCVDLAELVNSKHPRKTVIAPVETSATSSRAYSSGEQFFINDILREATTDIAQGDTLTLNTNYKNADPISTSIGNLTNQVTAAKKYEAVNGKKNYLTTFLDDAKNNTTTGSWNGNVWSFVGLNITFNPDCSLTIKGTQTGSPVNFLYAKSTEWDLVDGETYILVGPEGGNATTDRLEFYKDNTKVAELYNGATYEFTYSSSSTYLLQPAFRGPGTAHDITFKPMICPKRLYEIDPTWQSPTLSNEDLTQETTGLIDNDKVNGAVNMMPMTGDPAVKGGVTYTVNSDGTVSLSASGNSTSGEIYTSTTYKTLKAGTYKLSGIPAGWKDNMGLSLRTANNDIIVTTYEYGTERVFTLANDTTLRIVIYVKSGVNPNGQKIKPMVSVTNYTGEYVPFAKSNKELTEESNYEVDTTTISGVTILKKNGVVTLAIAKTWDITSGQNNNVGTLPERFRPPLDVYALLITNEGTPQVTVLRANASGSLLVNGYMISGSHTFQSLITYVTNK